MHIFKGDAVPFAAADVNSFTGPARTKRLALDDVGVPVHVYRVEFEEGQAANDTIVCRSGVVVGAAASMPL